MHFGGAFFRFLACSIHTNRILIPYHSRSFAGYALHCEIKIIQRELFDVHAGDSSEISDRTVSFRIFHSATRRQSR